MSFQEQIETNAIRNGTLRELVTFKAADQDFCVNIMSIREIRGWSKTTIMPHAPDYVLGVMNLRGSVVPVMDLSRRLGLGVTEADERHVIIIALIGDQTVGLLVESVSDILGISTDSIQPTPEIASESARSFVAGIICIDRRTLRLIDLEKLLPQTALDLA